MIEIWVDFTRYNTTNQRVADQVRTIIKKGCFSDFEILELLPKNIFREINQQASNTVTETLNTEMLENYSQKEK